jgi:hypothetical protein
MHVALMGYRRAAYRVLFIHHPVRSLNIYIYIYIYFSKIISKQFEAMDFNWPNKILFQMLKREAR